ncbi:MAG: PepSY domain-containing protein [Gammaproteobacteria bacterium]
MAAKLHKWHRRIGLVATAFIVFLVLTGIALQHSDDFKLNTQYLSNTWLLKYYGIKPNPISTYQLDNQTISHAGDTIYLSGKPVIHQVFAIHGAIKQANSEIIIATSDSLVVIDDSGNIIDEITTQDGLQETPIGIALSNRNTTVVRGINTYWESLGDLSNWQTLQGPHPHWVSPTITLPALKQVIETHDMSKQINFERFLLDAHSGRFFGKYGIYVIDIAAILLLILSITGIWLWTVRR